MYYVWLLASGKNTNWAGRLLIASKIVQCRLLATLKRPGLSLNFNKCIQSFILEPSHKPEGKENN